MKIIMEQLKFYDAIVPPDLKADHAKRGGRSLRRLVADIHDGELRIMVGYENWEGDQFALHVSVSVGKPFHIGSFRRPTDEELEAVKQFWPRIAFEEDNDGATSPNIRHLWQVAANEAELQR